MLALIQICGYYSMSFEHTLFTKLALIGPLSIVHGMMSLQVDCLCKCLLTNSADKWLDIIVDSHVTLQVATVAKELIA